MGGVQQVFLEKRWVSGDDIKNTLPWGYHSKAEEHLIYVLLSLVSTRPSVAGTMQALTHFRMN